jgi:hypothetical protein
MGLEHRTIYECDNCRFRQEVTPRTRQGDVEAWKVFTLADSTLMQLTVVLCERPDCCARLTNLLTEKLSREFGGMAL